MLIGECFEHDDDVSSLHFENSDNSTDKRVHPTDWLVMRVHKAYRAHTICRRIFFSLKGNRPGKPTHEVFGYKLFHHRGNH